MGTSSSKGPFCITNFYDCLLGCNFIYKDCIDGSPVWTSMIELTQAQIELSYLTLFLLTLKSCWPWLHSALWSRTVKIPKIFIIRKKSSGNTHKGGLTASKLRMYLEDFGCRFCRNVPQERRPPSMTLVENRVILVNVVAIHLFKKKLIRYEMSGFSRHHKKNYTKTFLSSL